MSLRLCKTQHRIYYNSDWDIMGGMFAGEPHSGVSSVDRHAVRASVNEDGAYNVGRREERRVHGGGRRGTILITERRQSAICYKPL